MVVRFTADLLESGLEEETGDPHFYVFVADATCSHYFTLQRGYPLDGADPITDENDAPSYEEDEGIYAEVNDQLFSGYDCISILEISATALRVELSRPLGRSCPITAVEITFPAGHRPGPEFFDHLRSIFFEREAALRIIAG